MLWSDPVCRSMASFAMTDERSGLSGAGSSIGRAAGFYPWVVGSSPIRPMTYLVARESEISSHSGFEGS